MAELGKSTAEVSFMIVAVELTVIFDLEVDLLGEMELQVRLID